MEKDWTERLEKHPEAYRPFAEANRQMLLVRSVTMSLISIGGWGSVIALLWYGLVNQTVFNLQGFAVLFIFALIGIFASSQIKGA